MLGEVGLHRHGRVSFRVVGPLGGRHEQLREGGPVSDRGLFGEDRQGEHATVPLEQLPGSVSAPVVEDEDPEVAAQLEHDLADPPEEHADRLALVPTWDADVDHG